jgi:hypothetical protein
MTSHASFGTFADVEAAADAPDRSDGAAPHMTRPAVTDVICSWCHPAMAPSAPCRQQ